MKKVKEVLKNIFLIMACSIIMIIIYYSFIAISGALFAYIFINLETPNYTATFDERNIISNEDKNKIAYQVLEWNYLPQSFQIIELKYDVAHDGDDGYNIKFKIDYSELEGFEKANNQRASNVFNIIKNTNNDICSYEYQCGSFGRDEKCKIIKQIIAKYD